MLGRDPRRDGVFRTVERREIGGKKVSLVDLLKTNENRETVNSSPGPVRLHLCFEHVELF